LCGAVIAERPAHRVDPRGQGRFGNHPPAPYRLQQIVLSDYPIAVQHKESQKIEGLGLKVDDIAPRRNSRRAMASRWSPNVRTTPSLGSPDLRLYQ
jgi:hypothetical protein